LCLETIHFKATLIHSSPTRNRQVNYFKKTIQFMLFNILIINSKCKRLSSTCCLARPPHSNQNICHPPILFLNSVMRLCSLLARLSSAQTQSSVPDNPFLTALGINGATSSLTSSAPAPFDDKPNLDVLTTSAPLTTT